MKLAQVHAMCAYLRKSDDKPCLQCPRSEQSPVFDGREVQRLCFGIAEETLKKARDIMSRRS